MAFTKPTAYLSIILVAIIFFVGIGKVGTDFASDSRIDLDEKSLDYINNVKGQSEASGYNDVRDTEVSETQSTSILEGENDTQVSTDNDFLSTLFIKKERASAPTNYIKLVYNIPTSLLIGFGVPAEPFNDYINIFTYTLLIAIIIMVWRFFVG